MDSLTTRREELARETEKIAARYEENGCHLAAAALRRLATRADRDLDANERLLRLLDSIRIRAQVANARNDLDQPDESGETVTP